MSEILFTLVRWSEIWALFIPLTIILLYKIKAKEMQPVILYVIIGLIINIPLVLISEYSAYLPVSLRNNGIFYNMNFVLRVVLFGSVIIRTNLIQSKLLFRFIIPAFLFFVAIDFIWLESLFSFSQRLATLENILLLAVCVSFFLLTITDDSDTIWMEQPIFLVCAGISLYESITFYVFLFFNALAEVDLGFSRTTMIIFSITFFIFNTILAVALYRSRDPRLDKEKLILTSKPSA